MEEDALQPQSLEVDPSYPSRAMDTRSENWYANQPSSSRAFDTLAEQRALGQPQYGSSRAMDTQVEALAQLLARYGYGRAMDTPAEYQALPQTQQQLRTGPVQWDENAIRDAYWNSPQGQMLKYLWPLLVPGALPLRGALPLLRDARLEWMFRR